MSDDAPDLRQKVHYQWRLRQQIYDRMADEWSMPYGLNLSHTLQKMLGIDYPLTSVSPMTEEQVEICKKLLGPHGYAYFKAWEAQNGL